MRNPQPEEIARVFINPRTGKEQTCRLSESSIAGLTEDPITEAYGVDCGEFINDWRKRDLREGCPFCRAEVEENLSEPDVLSRWGMR